MLYRDLVVFLAEEFQFPVTDATSASPSSDTDVNNILPRIIELAEQQIYTDMDFLQTRRTDHTKTCTANSRSATLPTGTMVVQGVAVVTPSTATDPKNGTRNTLEKASLDFIDVCYPAEATGATVPKWYALLDAETIVMGPTPDAAYTLDITGTYRPAAISATNTETYISKTYPQLLMQACAVAFCGHQRSYGAQASDPQQAVSWANLYQASLASARAEEKRRKGESINTSSTSPKAPAGEGDA